MWYWGQKHLDVQDAWRHCGQHPSGRNRWQPLQPGTPTFQGLGYLDSFSVKPWDLIASAVRCSTFKNPSLAIRWAAYHLSMALLSQVKRGGQDLRLIPGFKSWKDFVSTGILGQFGAAVGTLYMDDCGFHWQGHWEEFFRNHPGPAPDFLYCDGNVISLCETKASTGTRDSVNNRVKSEWRRQISNNLNGTFKGLPIRDGICIGIRLPHCGPAEVLFATKRQATPPNIPSRSIKSNFIPYHYSAMARVMRLPALRRDLRRSFSDIAPIKQKDQLVLFKAGGHEYITGNRSSFPICWDGKPYRMTFGLLRQIAMPVFQLASSPEREDIVVEARSRETETRESEVTIDWAKAHTIFGDGMIAILHHNNLPYRHRAVWNNREAIFRILD